MNIYAPYTYLIGWSHLNQYYYGVRYADGCSPSDLWVKYFTSSKYVKKMRKEHGEPNIIQIRNVFETREQAWDWEVKVLRRMNVMNEDRWINKNICRGTLPLTGPDNSMYGKTHSLESRRKISEKAKQRTTNSMQGKHHSKETRDKLSQMNKGENNPQFAGYFVTPWGKFASTTEAAERCPVAIRGWTINRWCKSDNTKVIHPISVGKSEYLKEDYIGKTFAELGFGFATTEA